MVLTSPPIFLSLMIASSWALLFHLVWGKSLADLGRAWIAGLIGFGVGQTIGSALGWDPVVIGEVNVLSGSLACWVGLILARWVRI